MTNETNTETRTTLSVGDRVRVLKGCNAREISKGITCQIREIVELGADFSHAVKVVFVRLNGFGAGKTFVMIARHINRLSDPVVSLNDGNPTHKIQIAKVG